MAKPAAVPPGRRARQAVDRRGRWTTAWGRTAGSAKAAGRISASALGPEIGGGLMPARSRCSRSDWPRPTSAGREPWPRSPGEGHGRDGRVLHHIGDDAVAVGLLAADQGAMVRIGPAAARRPHAVRGPGPPPPAASGSGPCRAPPGSRRGNRRSRTRMVQRPRRGQRGGRGRQRARRGAEQKAANHRRLLPD